jgi:hypothetical protein
VADDRGGGVREVRRRGAAWTAEEVHAAVKDHRPRYVVLPAGFPPEVARRLFVTDPDIWFWLRFPAVVSGAPSPDAVLLSDWPCAARTMGEWRRIVGCLHELGDGQTARDVQDALAGPAGQDPDEPVLVVLAEPADWLGRVARAEARLAAAPD